MKTEKGIRILDLIAFWGRKQVKYNILEQFTCTKPKSHRDNGTTLDSHLSPEQQGEFHRPPSKAQGNTMSGEPPLRERVKRKHTYLSTLVNIWDDGMGTFSISTPEEVDDKELGGECGAEFLHPIIQGEKSLVLVFGKKISPRA